MGMKRLFNFIFNRYVPCECGKFYRKAKLPHCWNCEYYKTGQVKQEYIPRGS